MNTTPLKIQVEGIQEAINSFIEMMRRTHIVEQMIKLAREISGFIDTLAEQMCVTILLVFDLSRLPLGCFNIEMGNKELARPPPRLYKKPSRHQFYIIHLSF